MKVKKDKVLKYWTIVWLLLSSGSTFFTSLNIIPTCIMLLFTSLMIGLYIKKINVKIVQTGGIIIGLLIILMIPNILNGFALNNFLIFLARVIFCVMLIHLFNASEFKRYYSEVMMFEAVISIICFFLINVVHVSSLPFQIFRSDNVGIGYYYTTFYYTIGWATGYFERNAGIFWEAGAHQIFLNFAILFAIDELKLVALNRANLNSNWKTILKILLLVVALLTSKSTTGYIAFGIIMIGSMFNGKIAMKKRYKIIIILVFIGLIVAEIYSGVVYNKLSSYTSGSFYGRLNWDTLGAFEIALTKPLVGYGFFRIGNAELTTLLRYYNILNISNGLTSLMISIGIPATLLWLFRSYSGITKLTDNSKIGKLLLFVFWIVICSTEVIHSLTFPILLLFRFKQENDEMIISNK